MKARCRFPIIAILASLALLTGCDAVDRARSRLATTDTAAVDATGSGLALALQAPGILHPGEEGMLRLSLTNQTDTVVSRVRLELIVPGWAEPMPPRPGDREVSMAALEDGGTRFAYRIDETPLQPAQTLSVEQRIRVPAARLMPPGTVIWGRTVQARLLDVNGRPLAEVESEIALDSIAEAMMGDSVAPRVFATSRDRLGPVRLGMTSDDLRRAAPGARDTTWSQEGMRQEGMLVPIGDAGTALAALDGDSVMRIEVREAPITTAERMGVGSRFDQLRAAYGAPCAEAAEGRVVVWFENAPGISFALDMPVPQNVEQLRQNPESIPSSSRVTSWWLRRGVTGCPR
jgi:hypothetical protein